MPKNNVDWITQYNESQDITLDALHWAKDDLIGSRVSLLSKYQCRFVFSSPQNPIEGQRRRLPTKGHPAQTCHLESSKESLRGPSHRPTCLLSSTTFIHDRGQGRPYPRQLISWFCYPCQVISLTALRDMATLTDVLFTAAPIEGALGLAPPLSFRAINVGFTSDSCVMVPALDI